MAANKIQGKQKGKDKFFITPNKHVKMFNKERKPKDFNSASDNFFLKTGKDESNTGNIFKRKKEKKEKNVENDETGVISKESKKPFDKKKYRLQKYSKKYKVQQWEERRKKAVMREYYREIKDDTPKQTYNAFERISEGMDDEIEEKNDNDTNAGIAERQFDQNVKKKKHFRKPHEQFQIVREEKQLKQQNFLKNKAERDEAKRKALKERAERSRKLSRKTKRGQPIMKYRMEMLLEKIQKSMNQ